MKLRPHHILDIVRSHGDGVEFTPHPYGHANHTVAKALLADVEVEVELVCGTDDICAPCVHLGPDGLCGDVLGQLEWPLSKQAYNDALDSRLFAHFGWTPGAQMPLRVFLEKAARSLPGLALLCAHPKEDVQRRLEGLAQGFRKLEVE